MPGDGGYNEMNAKGESHFVIISERRDMPVAAVLSVVSQTNLASLLTVCDWP